MQSDHDITREIITAFGGITPCAREIGVAVQTVSDWANKGKRIPEWRREVVGRAAERLALALSPDARAYLRVNSLAPDKAA